MKIGIIGPGRIAHSFCDAARQVEEAEVVAVASRTSLERAQAFAKDENIPVAYGNYEDMLADPEITMIYIATTHNYHYENIKQCLNAGKHVLSEKPMVLTEAECIEVIKLAKEKNLFLMEGMWSRFLPKSLKVREWVKAGRIGDVKLSQGTIGFVAPVDYDDRFYNPKLAGGVLLDMGIYLIDLLPYFACQEIKDIKATPMLASTGVDCNLNITMQLDDAIASGQATVQAVVPEDAYVYGSKGYIYIPKIHWGHEAVLYDENQKEVERFSEPGSGSFKYEIIEAIDCIKAGKLESDIASHEMTLATSRIYDKFLNEWKNMA